MNRSQRLICLCGIGLCLFLFMVTVPSLYSAGHLEWDFPPQVMKVLVIGWGLIITMCIYLFIKQRNGPSGNK
jgi:hypothetical protein